MAIQSGSAATGKFPVNLRNENLAAVIESPLGKPEPFKSHHLFFLYRLNSADA